MKKRFRPVLKIMITTSCVIVEEKKEEKIVGDEDKQDNALKHQPHFSLPVINRRFVLRLQLDYRSFSDR